MSGKSTRIGSDAVSEESRTDWARLRALTEDEIDEAIAADPDSYAIADHHLLGRRGGSFRYEIHRDSAGRWRWTLLSAGGEMLARGAQSFSSRGALEASLGDLREALLGGRSQAA